MNTHTSFCTFALDSLQLGVEVHRVQEVIRYQRMTRIPGANPAVAGLMNLRGQIVTAIDLRTRLGLPSVQEARRCVNVVLRTPDGPVSLLVDRIGDVAVVEGSAFEAPPETLNAAARRMLRGAYKLDRGLLVVLDADAILGQAA